MRAGRVHLLQRDTFAYVCVLITTLMFMAWHLVMQNGSIETINSSGLLNSG